MRKRKYQLMALASLSLLKPGATLAGDAGAGETPVVFVSGNRASLMSAREIKRDKLEIVDAIVADEIQKLPDLSVTDALQRITGVQVARDRGDGTNVAIRGLTQMETTLNGREVFTAWFGRNFDFADMPAEMLAGIDVYKTASADQIEGGIGGAIDLRTRRPLDFAGRELAATARLVRSQLAQGQRGQVSVLASDRWRGENGGVFGALLSVSHQGRVFREDQNTTGNPVVRKDLIAGQSVIAPSGTTESVNLGERERNAVSLVLQWRPSPALEWYTEASYARFNTRQDTHQITVGAAPTFVAGTPVLFPGTSDLKSITWTQAPVSILSFARDTVDRNRSLAVGGRWREGPYSLKADVSHVDSYNNLYFAGPLFAGVASRFEQDLAGESPSARVPGGELLVPANLRYASATYRVRPFDGKLNAAQLDGEYRAQSGWLDALKAGLRYASRGAGNAPGLIFGDAAVTGMTGASKPDLLAAYPYDGFFPGEAGSGITNYLVGNLASARDPAALRSAAGITAPLPVAGNPLSVWRIRERTTTAYLQARIAAQAVPLDGNAGVRIVRTEEGVLGSQSVPSSGSVAPIDIDTRYTDFLPSMNLRYALAPGVYLRGAASKTITRPNFDQLSPSLTLLPNQITPQANQGSAGNPDLKPVRSDNLDLALEHYFGAANSAYLTLFRKKVDGFVGTVSRTEVHDGASYQVSRPYNSDSADIKGAEFGYQQFFDFLPGWLKGLGLQANYTLIDSETPNSALGGNVPLQNLSRRSANLVGMYENEQCSARLAYNWRSRFLSSVSTIVGVGALPVYTKGYGWLDASFSYKASAHLTLSIEGSNLLRTVRNAYYGVETRPQSAWTNDRQISVTAMARF